ncbi:hypothetical protein PoB_002180700 [Plakobranchus ocellatus]|uniref:Uncharacterized protein n=1 Tax=Plakobranchus ocellatus TaxID=259542 RepID=A0AAV3ZL89_9GAST|nr:hypothetical protein PoB_002180700 [Plakobranchus ocellatus]
MLCHVPIRWSSQSLQCHVLIQSCNATLKPQTLCTFSIPYRCPTFESIAKLALPRILMRHPNCQLRVILLYNPAASTPKVNLQELNMM